MVTHRSSTQQFEYVRKGYKHAHTLLKHFFMLSIPLYLLYYYIYYSEINPDF